MRNFSTTKKEKNQIAETKPVKIINSLFILAYICFMASTQAYAQTCCPDFVLKDLIEICPPEGACHEGDNTDGHGHEPIMAACQESVHTYTVYPNEPIYTYEWTIVGGTPSSFTGNPVDIEWGNGTTGFITVVITGANGCEAVITEEICLIDGPMANFSFQPDTTCENTPVNFTNLSVGGGEYFWDFGDGNTSTDYNPTHSYGQPGLYEVTLTVTDFGGSVEGELPIACGCSDSITLTVEVLEGQGPVIETDCCDGTVCPGETSTFYTSTQCTNYLWTVTGGTIIAGQGTNEIVVEWDATYSVPTTVSLETPNCTGAPCPAITTVHVPVLYPNLPISGDLNFCQGSSGTFTLPLLPGTYYDWSITGGDYNINTPDQNTNTINITFVSGGTFEITAEYDNPMAGCAGMSSITVEVKPIFSLFSVEENLLCKDTKAVYFANGNVANWLVSPAGQTIDIIAGDAAEINWDTPGTYIIIGEAANPADFCNTSAMTQVEIVAPPQLDPIDGPTTVCPDAYLTYKISSDTDGSDFIWSIHPAGSGTIVSQMGMDKDSVVVSLNGAGPWTIEVYQEIEIAPGQSCTSDVQSIALEAFDPPAITSQSGNTQVCVDAEEIYFTSLPVPPGGFTWTITPANRGTIVSGQGTEEVEVRWHGTPANATLSVSSCSGSDQISIEIVDPPFIDFITANGPTLYCLPDTPSNLTLSTSFDPNYTYQWFLDGNPIANATSNQYTITSKPPTPQTYVYTVEASNGICTKTRGVLVVITDDCNGGPVITCDLDFTFSPDPACVGQPISFQATSIPPGYDFEWDFGDGSTSFTQNTQKAYNDPGTYNVALTGTFLNVCSLTVVKQVTVNPLPTCEILATDTIFCPGDSLLLEACAGMASYQWYREGSPISGANQQTYWATQHGEYQVEATNQFGCSDLSEGVYIFSHSTPRAKITGDNSICVNPLWFINFPLSTPYDANYSFEWSSNIPNVIFNPNNGNNAASTTAAFQLPTPMPAQIEFYVSVTDITTGCVNTDTLCVSVYEMPNLSIDYIFECEGPSHTLTPAPINTSQYHYLWSNGATTPEITISQAGFYSLQVTDKTTGCSMNFAAAFIAPKPDLSLFPTGCETLMIDEEFELYLPLPLNSSSWANTYPMAYPSIEWYDTDNNLLGTGQSFMFSSPVAGYFEVYAVVENYFGCSETSVVFCITVEDKIDDPEPEISVSKNFDNINGTDFTEFTQVGDVLTYNIVVCNTGNVTLFNLDVNDPLTGMNETITQLDPGDCMNYTTSYTVTQDDLDAGFVLNVATAEGEDENGNPVTGEDDETVTGTALPDIAVTKTLDNINSTDFTEFTQVGDVLTYNIVVCNTGNVTLFNLDVNDPLTGMNETIAQLDPGDCMNYTTSYTVTQDDLDAGFVLNVATAEGEDENGNPVTGEDDETVTGTALPDIAVTKTLDNINGTDQTAFTQVGDVLNYTIEVCNTGNVTLYNVGILDPFTFLNETIAQLDAGDCAVFTTSFTITQDELVNCVFENIVFATGEDSEGTEVLDVDIETVPCEDPFVPEPGLTVTKTLSDINGTDQTAFTQVGDVLTFTIVVTNTGNVPLTNVFVDDPVTGDSWTIPTLAPGDSMTFTTSYVITQGDLDSCTLQNIVDATGEDPDGNQIGDTDIISVPCDPDVQNPDISIIKTLVNINGTDFTEFTQVGDVLTYNIEVCNTGDVSLYNVEVVDPLTGLSANITQIDPNNCVNYTTSYTITQADLDAGFVLNVATAEGEDENGNPVAGEDDETVTGTALPDIAVTKTLDNINGTDFTEFTQVGDVLTYNIVVCNTGNVTLFNVDVNDPLTGMNETITQLDPGDCVNYTTSYTVTQDDLDAGEVINIVIAEGEDPNGNQVGAEDAVVVEGSPEQDDPGISIEKTLISINDNPNQTEYSQVGDVLTYALVVTNTGNVTLTNITVIDTFTGFSTTIPSLAPGDSVTFTTSYTIQQVDIDNGFFNNRASATGEGPDGTTVGDDDFEIVNASPDALIPGITITKNLFSINDNPDQNTYTQVGDILTYIIVVTNTGNVTLNNVVVNDPLTGFTTTIASLAPGDSQTFFTNYTVQQSDLFDDSCFVENIASAEATTGQGTVVTDSDTEIVECGEIVTVLYDFGDAPEGAPAYPPFSTIGDFPTCANTGVDGSFVRHGGNHELFFGEYVDYETDGNAGFCPTFSPNLYNQDECFQDGDAGLIRPRAYTIIGSPGNETVVPCITGGPRIPWFPCRWARWKTHIDIHVTNNLPGGAIAYANLLIDWNQDGEWGGSSICRNMDVPEHVLVNFEIPNGFSGPLSDLSPPNFRIGPNRGYIWTRFTVSETQVPTDWNGTGDFEYGETEDYLLHVRSPFVIVDAWDLIDIVVPLGVDTCFSATQTIRVGGEAPFVVEEGGSVDLRAGRSIRLLDGVRVEAGGYMHARIVTDPDDYCFVEEAENTQSQIVNHTEPITDGQVQKPEYDKGLRIYPNPTTGQVTLELIHQTEAEMISVEVFSMMGDRIIATELTANIQHVFDLSGQPRGIYFMRVYDGKTFFTKRIIRQ